MTTIYEGYTGTKANANLDLLPQFVPPGRPVASLGAYLANNAVITPKDFGAGGLGSTDDTVPVQNAMNASRDLGIRFSGGDGQYRITAGLTTQYDGNYKANDQDWGTSIILADFVGAPALTIVGGVALQRVRNLTIQPTVARRLGVGGAYVAANTGVKISNCRHDVTGIASYFGGDGWLFENTAPNSNYSRHDVEAFQCGRGARITGSNDNFSVVHSTIKPYGCSEEGIRTDAGTMMRQWDCFWKSENNLQADTNNVAKYDIYVLSAITCWFWVYSEHGATAAGEFYLDPVGATNCDAWSVRRNKDVISGSNIGHYGNSTYQTGDANRRSTIEFNGLNTRKGNVGEWMDLLFKGLDGTIGRLRFESLSASLMSASAVLTGPNALVQGQGTSVGATDKFAYVGRERVYTDLVPLTAATQTRTINICTLAASSAVAGRLTTSGVSGGGGGIMTSVIDFRCDGTVLTQNAAIIGSAAGPNPSTAVLQVVGGVLQLVFTYVQAQWGASYSFDYSVKGTFVNVT